MTISSIMTTALSGMQTEQNRMLTAAGNIARAGPGASAPAASPGMTESETSLAHELVEMKQAETGFKANALVLATGADLWDVLMTIKRD